MTLSIFQLPTGHLKVEVFSKSSGDLLQTVSGSNALTLEAIKLLLGQLVGPSLLPSAITSTFPEEDTSRPDPGFLSSGPRSANSIAFIGVGYADEPPATQASPEDTDLVASTVLFEPLTSVSLKYKSLEFVFEYDVTSGLVGKKLFEAALFTLGTNTYNSQQNQITSSDKSLGCIMFSRKVHSQVLVNPDTTLRYTWTISMSDPE